MHEHQYRDYRSGIARERFLNDLEELKAKAGAPVTVKRPVVEMPEFPVEEYAARYPHAVPVQAPAAGKVLWEIDVEDDSAAPVAGTAVKAGKPCGHVQTRYGIEDMLPAVDGRFVAVLAAQGKDVVKGEIVAFIQ